MKIKVMAAITLTASACLISSFYLQRSALSRIDGRQVVNSGINTCFERTSQSFISLMNKSFSSNYLTKSFLNTTWECFEEASNYGKKNALAFSENSRRLSAQMKSDYYWFSQKALKLKALKDYDVKESNIVQKYSSLGDLKAEFNKNVSEAIGTDRQLLDWLFYSTLGGLGLLLVAGVYPLLILRKEKRLLGKIEQQAQAAQGNSMQAFTVVQELLKKLHLSKTQVIFNQLMLDKSKTVAVDSKSAQVTDPKIESTKLAGAVQDGLSKLHSIVQSKGIKVQIKNLKEFNVKGSEDLIDEVVFQALNYAVKSSTEKVIQVDCSLLGGTALLKIIAKGHCVNSNELEYLNNDGKNLDGVNLDLRLLKEITDDLEGAFCVRNKIDTSKGHSHTELELVFSVANVASKRNISIQKGSKKEILRQMSAQM